MNRTKENTWRKVQGKDPLKPMPDIVASLKGYISTYDKQQGYEEYSDEILIEDMLYGIGTALSEDYKYRNGYIDFKKRLIKLLIETTGEEKNEDTTS